MSILALSSVVALDLWADLEQRVRSVRQPVTDEELDRMAFEVVRKLELESEKENREQEKDHPCSCVPR